MNMVQSWFIEKNIWICEYIYIRAFSTVTIQFNFWKKISLNFRQYTPPPSLKSAPIILKQREVEWELRIPFHYYSNPWTLDILNTLPQCQYLTSFLLLLLLLLPIFPPMVRVVLYLVEAVDWLSWEIIHIRSIYLTLGLKFMLKDININI